MSYAEATFDPKLLIQDIFAELRHLYNSDGCKKQIEDEISYMTGGAVHRQGSEQCLLAAKQADAFVFDPNADVISEYLDNGNDLSDTASETLVRRLLNPRGYFEVAHFNSWLESLGFEPLKRVR